jgi:hypothetical protein
MSNSVGYYNFKKVVDLLRQLQTYHEQLQSFGIGDITQLNYDIEERLKIDNTEQNYAPYYPLMYVIPNVATTDGRETVYEFDILIMDIQNTKNFDNQVDAWSDTLDILKDVIAQLKYSLDACYCTWDLDYPISMTPFHEAFDDYVDGWTGKIRLRIPDAINRCDAPYAEFPPCDNNANSN